jgi:hypothetical protein
MNNRGPLSKVGAVAAVIVLVIIAAWVGVWWTARERAQAKLTLASGYDDHSLFTPFMLQSKTWQPVPGAFSTSGTWTYTYTASVPGPQALAAAEKQLSQGGYQVVETSPDVITASSAAIYRDLITGDDSIKVAINLLAKPVTAVVTISPLEGN